MIKRERALDSSRKSGRDFKIGGGEGKEMQCTKYMLQSNAMRKGTLYIIMTHPIRAWDVCIMVLHVQHTYMSTECYRDCRGA